MSHSVREPSSCKHLLDAIKKAIPFSHGLVLTTLPRGGLQLAQPINVPDGLLRAYAKGFHAEDRLTWQAIVGRKPVKAQDCWDGPTLRSSPYWLEWMQPLDLKHAIALPMAAPVLDGYPGAVHLTRSADQGEFRAAEIDSAADAIKAFEQRVRQTRNSRPNDGGPAIAPDRPDAHLAIVDGKLRPRLGPEALSKLDPHLRQELIEETRRRFHHTNGDGFVSDRLQISDSLGDAWIFRVVAYKKYPALGDGPFAFLCLLPACKEWLGIRPADFQADTELARLIPALRFMQEEFHRGPTLVEIAATVKLSPFHFHRRFTELLGITPKQFLLECQIEKAKSDLLGHEKELARIARECGFAHQSHFTSRFKQATGLTPTRWRRVMLEHLNPSSN